MNLIQTISAQQAKQQCNEQSNTLVIDVRERSEVATSAVAGAVNIPLGGIGQHIGEVVSDQRAPLLLCCAKGGRAGMAAKTLQQMGYSNAKVIDSDHQSIRQAFEQ